MAEATMRRYLEHQSSGPRAKKNKTGMTKLLGAQVSLTKVYNALQAEGGIEQVHNCCTTQCAFTCYLHICS